MIWVYIRGGIGPRVLMEGRLRNTVYVYTCGKEGKKEGRKEGRKDGGRERRKGERKENRTEEIRRKEAGRFKGLHGAMH
jgi:hypothetical protein